MSGGKGGSTSTQSSSQGTSSTQIPAWLESESQTAVQRADALSNQAYTPYTGEMVAGTTADTQQAYQQVRDLQGAANPAYNASQAAYSGLLGQAQALTPDQINQQTNQLYGNYGANVLAPATGLLGGYLSGGPATAQDVANNQMTMMSPFSQAVINPTLKLGQQQLAQNLQTVGANANQSGAFGGTRQGVMEGVAQAQSALGSEQYIGNLLNTQWQNSMNPATQIALQAGQQGYGAAGNLAGMLGTGYSAAQQQAGNIAGTNLQAGLTAAQQLPTVATAQQSEAAKEAGLLQAAGQAQQAQQQAIDTSQMGQFYEAQQYPYQQLDTLLSALGAVPYSTTGTSSSTGTSTQQTNPGLMNQISGAVGTAATVASMFSDERLKTNINRVGKTDGGTPIYTYKYKGDSGPAHMGVLAQELAKRQPSAVTDMGGGLLGVNYSKVA